VCPTGESAPASSHTLGDFGPTQTPDEAAATSVRAIKKVTAAGGGVLFLRPDAPKGWQIKNTSQEVWREPSPPAPAKRWGYGPGATVLDTRGGTVTVHPPHMTGLRLERRFAAPEGQGSPHWDSHPMLSLSNSIVRGSTSYRDWLQADVPAGEDRRFYVRTSRGLFPGMFLNTGDHGKVSRLYVKRLGYDRQRNEPYFVADVDQNVAKGAILHNKTHTNLLRMDTYANSENQTFDVMNWRHDYSQGDSYMFEASFNYMSDVHSTAGDENGVLYAAFVRSEITPFRGRVASWSPAARELRYRAGRYAHTLATGRPLINMNPDKWITKGRLWIRAPGGALLGWAGTIRSQDAPWTAEVIGRYLAIDEPDEYVPGSDAVRRWWRITHFAEKDGVKRLSVERHWWGSKSPHGISRLYSYRNFTIHEDQPRLLRYIIAPGANVYDISEGAWPGRIGGGEKSGMVRLAPGPHDGTSVDFGAGDPVEQAIGPDPFRPIPFRSWLFEKVPGAFPAPVFDIANRGPISRYAVMTVHGGSARPEDYRNPAKPLPQLPWNQLIRIETACENGIVFDGDVANAAIQLNQPSVKRHRTQNLRWEGKVRRIMSVTNAGDLAISGAAPLGLADKPLTQAQGLSARREKASNLRGLDTAVPEGATSVQVRFDTAERNPQYAVLVRPSWITNHAVTERTADGFTVAVDHPAPVGASLDWVIVR